MNKKRTYIIIDLIMNILIILFLIFILKKIKFEFIIELLICISLILGSNFLLLMDYITRYSSINYDHKGQKLTDELIQQYKELDSFEKESVFDQCIND